MQSQSPESLDSGLGESGFDKEEPPSIQRFYDLDGLDEVPAELAGIFEGVEFDGDSGSPQDLRPPWYDEELFRVGQVCALRHVFSIAFSELLGLLLMFSYPSGLDPLIATRKSDTPAKAFRRYLSTGLHLRSWYETDPFDSKSEAWRSLVAVRRVHQGIRQKFERASRAERTLMCTLTEREPGSGDSAVLDAVRSDFSRHYSEWDAGRPGTTPAAIRFHSCRFERKLLSQFEMAATQLSFFGLFVLRPDLFGAHDVTERDLAGLVHMWAVLGHCLGIEDRFNICQGGLEPTRRRADLLLHLVEKPQMAGVSGDWEHMSRCVVDGVREGLGVGTSLEVALCYLGEDVMAVELPALRRHLTWGQWLALQVTRFLMQTLTRVFPAVQTYLSKRVVASVDGLKHLVRVQA